MKETKNSAVYLKVVIIGD